MSAPHHDEDDFAPSATPGYKPGTAKTVDEYATLDAEDESLARWKASLGIVPGAAGAANGPKVTILTLELASPSMPPGKTLIMNLQNPAVLADMKKNPVTIKEGIEYNVRITFQVNHSIISGVRYMQVVKRAGVRVDKMEQMLGSYGVNPKGEPYVKNFDPEESPSGMLARSGTYSVRSRVVDDDGEVYADWEWSFKLGKEW
ncbi:rho GDP-dissociation inhibitor [Phanerochaete sordida]|uniref:Rho GDP-dissociation inhibitor n=1 Tax=Phanerochaete sordida TaxID=48140 RepID=A0A9P3FYG1_9APHY|nr:rho GDP-dissociation inhibitor [Phanerochaete sordida]